MAISTGAVKAKLFGMSYEVSNTESNQAFLSKGWHCSKQFSAVLSTGIASQVSNSKTSFWKSFKTILLQIQTDWRLHKAM